MYERTLQTAERLLAVRPSSLVPVRDLWRSVCKETRSRNGESCTLPDFAALLEADPRFDFIQREMTDEELDALQDPEGDNELKNLGFLTESSVRLKSARPLRDADDDEEIPSITLRHLSETAPVRPVIPKKSPVRSAPKKSVAAQRTTRSRGPRRKR